LSSAQYLTRWAVLDILGSRAYPEEVASPEWQLRVRLYTQLLRDPTQRVRAEAEYQQALLDFEAEYRQALLDHTTHSASMSTAVRRAARREIERRRPSMCFSDLEVAFGNYLYHNARQDYTVSELDQFVQQQAT